MVFCFETVTQTSFFFFLLLHLLLFFFLVLLVLQACSADLSSVNYGVHTPTVHDITENVTLTINGTEMVKKALVFKAITTYQAALLEAFATAVLVLTVLSVAVDSKSSGKCLHLAPLAIGMAVTTGIYAM